MLIIAEVYRLPAEIEAELNLTHHESVREMVPHLDVVTINAPLHPEIRGLFNDDLISTMKRGAYLINTARALIVDQDAVVRASTAVSSPDTRVTSGTRSPHRCTTRGGPCRTRG